MKQFLNRGMIFVYASFLIVVTFSPGLQAEEIKCIDVSGTWESTEETDVSDCGAPNRTEQYTYQLIQKIVL